MKGKWKVTTNYIAGEKLFAVCRVKDTREVEHSGNREYATDYMSSREKAQKIADELNLSESEKNK